jgi:outer membrane protein assembly factor BamB
MSGSAPAVDANGNLYLSSGDGGFDATSSAAPNNDYGDSVLQIDQTLTIKQYFSPSDEELDYTEDLDLGSGGPILIDLPDSGSNPTHLLVVGGKDGTYYILNRDMMGGLGNSKAWQLLYLTTGIFSTPAYWNNTLYVTSDRQGIQAYPMNLQTAKVAGSPISVTPTTFGFPGTTPVISSMPDESNGILWAIDVSGYCTPRSRSCGPAVLHAYSADNLATELWSSSMDSANTAGYPVKFTQPTVANGHVYIGTRGNNIGGQDNSTSIPGELDVFGILNP